MIFLGTDDEYLQWKQNAVAQQEYSTYLLKETLKTAPPQITEQLTSQFNDIFKEKS
jgi:hypothetical protein